MNPTPVHMLEMFVELELPTIRPHTTQILHKVYNNLKPKGLLNWASYDEYT